MYFIIVVGTAGSGKSTLTSALYYYLVNNQLDAVTVNLDPAVESLPYKPDIDAREIVNARDLMRRYGLGPNGALVRAVDILSYRVDELRDEIWSLKANYVIVDTPGQMEIFAFRESGPAMLDVLIGDTRSVTLFLIDSIYLVKPSNYLSALLLASSTYFRLKLPQILVYNKIDLLPEGFIDKLINYKEDPYTLADELAKETMNTPMLWGIDDVYTIVEKLQMYEIVPVSSKNLSGFNDLYAAIQRVVAGGEDYYTEEPSPRL